MNRRRPLTQLVHERLAEVLVDGTLAVDATVGNGHDTQFLAEQVGPSGHVWGFDIQASALEKTREQLLAHGLIDRVSLLHTGHERMNEQLPAEARGQLSAVTFNLGYLPGTDKRITTLPGSTLQALAASVDNLRPGGLLSVLAYRGHAGGMEEAQAVANWLENQERLEIEIVESPGPVLFLARKH